MRICQGMPHAMKHSGVHKAPYASHNVSHFRRSTRYLIVALLPLLLCWILIINQSREWAMAITEQNATNLVEKNAVMIDKHFSGLRQDLFSLLNDQNFNELMLESSESTLGYVENADEIDTIVGQYFWNLEDELCIQGRMAPSAGRTGPAHVPAQPQHQHF